MSSLPRFTITPGSASKPTPVTITLPAHGYTAGAAMTDVCGKSIPGSHLTITGNVATPHLPASFQGTFFIDWRIQQSGSHNGLGIAMTMASRQQQGHASKCPTSSPYGKSETVQAPKDHALTVLPAHSSFPVMPVTGAVVLLAVVILAAVLWRRLTRHTGSRAAR